MADGGFDPSMLFLGDPQGMAQILAIQRQQALAQRLMGSQPVPYTIGGYPTGPGAFLAQGVGNVLGAYEQRKADEGLAKLYGGIGQGQGGGLLRGPQSFQPTDTGQVSNKAPAQSATQSGTGLGVLQQPEPEAPPKQQQQPQSQQAGGFVSPYLRAYFAKFANTDLGKQAAEAYGFGTPQYYQALEQAVTKAGEFSVRPSSTSFINGQPFTAPASMPEGAQMQWGPNGPQVSMVPGAAGAIAQSTSASAFPKAQANIFEAQNTPKPIVPGEGQVFATPAGGARTPTGLPAPTTNLISPNEPNFTGALPPGHPAARPVASNLGTIPGVPTSQLSMSPQGLNWMKSEGPAQLEEVKNDAEAAQDAHYQLSNLSSELKGLGTQGFLAPGKGAEQRVAIAKWVNSTARAAGQNPPDWASNDKIAAAEGALKTGGRLGFALSRSLGAREAAQIVQQAISLNPGIMNTPQGNALVTRSMDAVAQRQADRNIFFTQWMQRYGNTFNADVAFNQTHPIGSYVGLAAAPDEARARLKANPHEAPLFDQTFGQGASARILNEPW